MDGERHQYSWKLTYEDCLELAELVDGVIAAEHPCHQYLSQQYCDDATVVVSKGEYGDDVFA